MTQTSTPASKATASAISRALRAGGLRPLPSGTSRMREGTRVSSSPISSWIATVSTDLDNEADAGRVSERAATTLTQAGFIIDRRTPTMFAVVSNTDV